MSETPVPNPKYWLKGSLAEAKQSLRDIPEWAGGTGESLRERDRAIWLLKEWDKATVDLGNLHRLSAMLRDTRKFLEGLNDQP